MLDELYSPVAIRIAKEGIAILLNFLPTRIIIVTLSSTDSEMVFKSGAKTIPMKIEPPTQMEAETRCAHISRASKTGMSVYSIVTSNIY